MVISGSLKLVTLFTLNAYIYPPAGCLLAMPNINLAVSPSAALKNNRSGSAELYAIIIVNETEEEG